MRTLLSLSFAVTAVAANAAGNWINQIGAPAAMGPAADFGVIQIFGDFPTFSGMAIDNVDSSAGSILTEISVAYEVTDPGMVPANFSWTISGFTSAGAAVSSLTGDAGSLSGQTGVATQIFGVPGTTNRTFITTISGLNLNVAGANYVGMAVERDFGLGGQVFILNGVAGTPGGNNGIGVSPGGGFGQTRWDTQNNFAYDATVVPEPATMIALGAGLAALAARRRRK
ncbi:MAG: PEP-CTERM sorting domain-containing protein [Fimbriimonadaceae bacterium]